MKLTTRPEMDHQYFVIKQDQGLQLSVIWIIDESAQNFFNGSDKETIKFPSVKKEIIIKSFWQDWKFTNAY